MLYIMEMYITKKGEENLIPGIKYTSYHGSIQDAKSDIDYTLNTLLDKHEDMYGEDDGHDLDWFKSICSDYYDIDISILEIHNPEMFDIDNSRATLDKYNVVDIGKNGCKHLTPNDVKMIWDELLACVIYWYDVHGNQLSRYEYTAYLEERYRPLCEIEYKVGDRVETDRGIGTIVEVPQRYGYISWSMSYEVHMDKDDDYYMVQQNKIKLLTKED